MIDHLSMGIVELFLICFVNLCLEREPVCSPGSCECGPLDAVVAVGPLTVCVFM